MRFFPKERRYSMRFNTEKNNWFKALVNMTLIWLKRISFMSIFTLKARYLCLSGLMGILLEVGGGALKVTFAPDAIVFRRFTIFFSGSKLLISESVVKTESEWSASLHIYNFCCSSSTFIVNYDLIFFMSKCGLVDISARFCRLNSVFFFAFTVYVSISFYNACRNFLAIPHCNLALKISLCISVRVSSWSEEHSVSTLF